MKILPSLAELSILKLLFVENGHFERGVDTTGHDSPALEGASSESFKSLLIILEVWCWRGHRTLVLLREDLPCAARAFFCSLQVDRGDQET